MRGPEKSATVVRKSDGTFAIEEKSLIKHGEEHSVKAKLVKLPVIRGVYNLFVSLKDGMKALNFSAQFFDEEVEEEPSKFERWLEEKLGSKKVEKLIMDIALFFGIIIPVGLFILLPTLLAGIFDRFIGTGILRNLLEGAIRIAIFLIFMFLVSRMKDIKRTFAYHGAEHKTIHCYEAGQALNVENVRLMSRLHPRCGTSFLFVVMIISILVFSFVSWSNPFIRMALRLLLLPVVVGLSYEFNRYVGRHDNALTKALRAPGMALQRLTTNEPDDSMIEVAIEALERVIPENEGSDRW